MANVLIIAEAGVNHNGDISLARQLIDAAANAGADIVKFQTFCADRLVTKNAVKAKYQVDGMGESESQYDMLRRLELTSEAHDQLMGYSKRMGIEFLSTPFDIESVDLLAEKGIKRFKIPSGEITNLPYLRRVASVAKEVIISTGMATLEEIKEAIAIFDAAGISRRDIIALHCTSEYPAPLAEVNLLAMAAIGREFGLQVGYSDHTEGIEVAIAAVALGAVVIEKHFTIDRNLPGPDHKASLEPMQLGAMISAIRNIELALGNGIKAPSESEMRNREAVRKSLVAIAPIKKGDIFSEFNVGAKRPGNGISPMRLDDVIGVAAPRNFSPDELIEL